MAQAVMPALYFPSPTRSYGARDAALVPPACLDRAAGRVLLGCCGASSGPGSGKGGVAGCFDLLSTCSLRRRPGRRASRGWRRLRIVRPGGPCGSALTP